MIIISIFSAPVRLFKTPQGNSNPQDLRKIMKKRSRSVPLRAYRKGRKGHKGIRVLESSCVSPDPK
ncbi:hypothetical protein SD80_013315 [Scytonema tolypothrichoides VB-61278]|nr:hypothetical protein SD80_013315 [Scytonema tolypothrichoides VB-61278]